MTDPLGFDRVMDLLRRLIRALQNGHDRRANLYALSVGLGKAQARARLAGRLFVRWVARGVETGATLLARFAKGPLVAARWALERLLSSRRHAAHARVSDMARKTLRLPDGELDPDSLPLAERLAAQARHAVQDERIARQAGAPALDVEPALVAQMETVLETETAKEVARGQEDAAFDEARTAREKGRGHPAHVYPLEPAPALGFEFRTAKDDRVRCGRPRDNGENHCVLDGIRAAGEDPIWGRFTPPLGFGCRCVRIPVLGGPWTANALTEALSRGASAAPGFGSVSP